MPRLLVPGQRILTIAQRDRLLARIDLLNTRAQTSRYARPYTGRATSFECRLKAVARRLRRFLAGCEGNEWVARGRAIQAAYESGEMARITAEEELRWLGLNVRKGERIGDEDKRRNALAVKTAHGTYGEHLRAARLRTGMTQKGLAEHLRITPQAVSQWEAGHSAPTIRHISRLANFWNVDLAHLLIGHPEVETVARRRANATMSRLAGRVHADT